MKRSMFRLLTVCFSTIAITLFASAVFAQGRGNGGGNGGGGNGGGEDPPVSSPFNYRVELVDFHVGNNGSQGKPSDIAMVDDDSGESLFVVGWSRLVSGESRAFVYDHKNNNFIDVPTLLGLDEQTWITSRCRAISDNGIVVGYLSDGIGPSQGFWFDLMAAQPTLNLLTDTFPEIDDGSSHYGRDVNVNGDILTQNEWIVNIYDGTSQQLPTPFLSVNGGATAISDVGDVIGYGENGALRYNIHSSVLEEITDVSGGKDINNWGEFCGEVDIPYGKKNRLKTTVFRWGNGADFDWVADPSLATYANQLNDSGDVVGQSPGDRSGVAAFMHYSEIDTNGAEIGTTYRIKDLVSDTYVADAALGFMLVTERDASLLTPAPIIVGNAESGTDEKIFIMIPEDQP